MTNTDLFQAPSLGEIARWAIEKPEAPALLASGKPAVSFAALAERIASVAQGLRAAGVRARDVVAVVMPDGPELLTTLLGTLEAAAVAPVNWQLTEAEFRSQLTLLPACLLLVNSANDGPGPAVARTLGIPVLELEQLGSGSLKALHNDVSHNRDRAPENCALILQTSATTGEAKLVPFTHANLQAICVGTQRGLAFHGQDRYMSIMPLHHILGFSSALGQLMIGGSVACTGFDAQRFAAWIEELGPSWYAAGPALHQAILEIAKQDPGPFLRSPLRFVRCGSGAGSPALLDNLERVLQVDIINGYGLTEAGPVTNTLPGLPRKTGSVGKTIGPEIGIMDAGGALLPPDSEGEVVLRGEAVMDGYIGAEEVNRVVFRGGWFHTGDLGRLDRDGDLFITGRIKEIINRGGETISPLEIDNAMAGHPAIARWATFGVAHPTLGEDVVAAVVLRPGSRVTEPDVRSFLAERLSRSKVPGRIWFVDSIPLSASGKPLRSTLSAQFQARAAESRESPALEDEPSAALSRRISDIWKHVLNSDLPCAEDNFFAMGGDSLSAARLFALLESEFQLEPSALEPAKFLDSPTYAQLIDIVSGAVRQGHGSDAPSGVRTEMRFDGVSAVCLQPAGVGLPLFFFPGEDLDVWYLRHLVRSLGDQQPFFAMRHRIRDAAEFSDIAGRFTTLISRLRPDGPIVLAGHCYGGILAYEIAQRMIAGSRPDVAVVLMDVATPGYPKAHAGGYLRQIPEALGSILRGDGSRVIGEMIEHFRFIRALRKGERTARRELSATKSARPINGNVPSLSPGSVVLRTYAPRPFAGVLANALAGGHQASERVLEDSRKGWREFARGQLLEGAVAGEHISIFNAQNAPVLANFIRSTLQKLVRTTRPAVP